MAIVFCECWKCEHCSHKWLRVPYSNAPRLCAKCKRTGWHTEMVVQPLPRLPIAPPQPAPRPAQPVIHPPIADRAATMANLRQVVAGIESAEPTPIEPTPIEMCSYEEWSGELGEMVRCRLAMHAPKVKHKL